MEVPFIGGHYEDYSLNLNAQICQNLYPVVDQTGGEALFLESIPGMVLIIDFEV